MEEKVADCIEELSHLKKDSQRESTPINERRTMRVQLKGTMVAGSNEEQEVVAAQQRKPGPTQGMKLRGGQELGSDAFLRRGDVGEVPT